MYSVLCIHSLLFELKNLKRRLFSKYAEQNDTGQTSGTTITLYTILLIRAMYIRRINM
jgi:hypothetical protein